MSHPIIIISSTTTTATIIILGLGENMRYLAYRHLVIGWDGCSEHFALAGLKLLFSWSPLPKYWRS
jgi:hypothetical protein